MARSPLFGAVRRAMNLAALSLRPGAPPLDVLFEQRERRAESRAREWSRREVLSASALAAAAASTSWLAACGAREAGKQSPAAPRIAIVGAGVAGLNCAYTLKKAGLTATIYEAADRTGGRMFTAKDLMAPGLVTELGGEFIDSDHKDIFNLMTEFGLEKVDLFASTTPALKKETFFFNGRHYTEEQLVRAMVPLCEKMLADYDTMEEIVNFEKEGGGRKYDQLSIAQYLDQIGARGWVRELLDVAYLTEYGLECGEQSCLNLLFLIDTDPEEDGFALFGDSDERWKVRGGNERITDELAKRLPNQIQLRHHFAALKSKGAGYTLTFHTSAGKSLDVDADVVVLTLPFNLLREVTMQVELPDWKKRAISELGYGRSAKVMAGFSKRVWQQQGYFGPVYSDESFQLAWDNAQFQPGDAAGFTMFSGGKMADEVGKGTAEEAAKRLLPGLARCYPGIMTAFTGKTSRFHWPTYQFAKCGYSCFKVGQWTTIAGAEGRPVGNLFFAGEHCSYDFQGYMNGGAETGRVAGEQVIAALSGKRAAA